jgi:cell wall-associated NlpC family hydrolase
MWLNAKRVIAALIVCGLVPYPSSSQPIDKSESSRAINHADDNVGASKPSTAAQVLTLDDGLAVIAAALDSRTHLRKRDCSHVVHAIYDRAGFAYRYARSSDLYIGTDEFQRVVEPQVGDLVVWRGHVGIVVNPARHVFFSALRSGLGIDIYDAPYWKKRGQVRFYRFIKVRPGPDGIKTR